MTRRRTVEDRDGNRYILLKESAESSLVRDPDTDERRHIPNDELEPVGAASPLVTATGALPDEVVTLLTAVPDRRGLGLVLELDAEGPLRVRTLLASYDLCESDLHGLLAELRAAGLLRETTVAGQRGYDTTETASAALDGLR